MTVETQMLAWSTALGIVHLLIAASLSTMQRGLKWNAGPRDGVPAALTGVAARVDRAWRNFLETFGFFAVAVIVVVISGRANAETALGAQLYFWARVAYVPVYAAGIPFLRTLVWAVSLWGMLKILLALF
jgi:uncharacterized MAPEG superfamily protein